MNKSHLALNPIIVKELRSRMRGGRAFAVLTAMLLLLGGVSYLLYRLVVLTSGYSGFPLSPQIGQVLFVGLVLLEMLSICFITPAITAGAISSEREKLTYEMLLTTPLRPASILWGKLVSALGYIFLLIFAAVPMTSLVFIFGGVAPFDMVKALAILLVVTVTLGVMGIFFSTWLGRTTRAMVLSYLAMLALLLGPTFVFIFVGVLRQAEPPAWILIPNPVSALFSALVPAQYSSGPSNIIWELGRVLSGNLGSSGSWSGLPRPLYHYTLVLYGALSLSLYLLAIRLVRPVRRWRIGWKGAAVALAVLGLFGAVVAVGFFATTGRYERVQVPATPTPPPAVPEMMMAVPVRVAPLPPTPTPLPPTPVLAADVQEEASIYGLAIRQLLTTTRALGDLPDPLVLYISRITQDGLVDPQAPSHSSREVPQVERQAVRQVLADLPATIHWRLPQEDDPPGLSILLGNLQGQEDASVLLSASLYAPGLGSIGQMLTFEEVDGAWRLKGDTDPDAR